MIHCKEDSTEVNCSGETHKKTGDKGQMTKIEEKKRHAVHVRRQETKDKDQRTKVKDQ